MVTDKELIDVAAKGLPLEREPFRALAERFGITQEEVVSRLKGLIEAGKIRRFSASVRHQPMGYRHNAMILARTDVGHLDEVGETACAFPAVSHCYQRSHPDGDPWCVYIMVHGQDAAELDHVIDRIKGLTGVKGVEVCTSLVELKKSSLSGITTSLSRNPLQEKGR